MENKIIIKINPDQYEAILTTGRELAIEGLFIETGLYVTLVCEAKAPLPGVCTMAYSIGTANVKSVFCTLEYYNSLPDKQKDQFGAEKKANHIATDGITIEEIRKEYHENDLCMGELLASFPAGGLNLEEAFELYLEAKKWADGDKFFRMIDDNEPLEEL
ncbi:hypothetical protein [Dysgonomonas sp. ZJ709]|uniref:hypothetical protein n=1 Tax=Dysgonomonas sp. ZJ709 TaxID=2709797 RepID=UPI002101F336|nr:hypothetical protein [Dysgonomonas sp. ZJ709]